MMKFERSNWYFVIAAFSMMLAMGLFTGNLVFAAGWTLGLVCIGLGIREMLTND